MNYAIRIDRIEGVYVMPSVPVREMYEAMPPADKAVVRVGLFSGKEVFLTEELPIADAARVCDEIKQEVLMNGCEFLTSEYVKGAIGDR